jgi:hypothetical protein
LDKLFYFTGIFEVRLFYKGEIFMQNKTISRITDKLQKLPPEKLIVVYDFISYLLDREIEQPITDTYSESYLTMVASESVLQKDWERKEEDEAWSNL